MPAFAFSQPLMSIFRHMTTENCRRQGDGARFPASLLPNIPLHCGPSAGAERCFTAFEAKAGASSTASRMLE